MGKGLNTRKGARLYHPPSGYFGTSCHAILDPESFCDPKLIQSSRIAIVVEEDSVEDFDYLVSTTPYDGEDGLLFMTTNIQDSPTSPSVSPPDDVGQ